MHKRSNRLGVHVTASAPMSCPAFVKRSTVEFALPTSHPSSLSTPEFLFWKQTSEFNVRHESDAREDNAWALIKINRRAFATKHNPHMVSQWAGRNNPFCGYAGRLHTLRVHLKCATTVAAVLTTFLGSLSKNFKDAPVLVESMILLLRNIGTVQDPRHFEVYFSGFSQNSLSHTPRDFSHSIFSPEYIGQPLLSRYPICSFDLLGYAPTDIKLLPYIFPTTILNFAKLIYQT
ncbi:hypothetical protein EAF00_001347 [Botryotinia globosa]|nr:hypothetical protein EAF00_001347 [Botryotinia globosa]